MLSGRRATSFHWYRFSSVVKIHVFGRGFLVRKLSILVRQTYVLLALIVRFESLLSGLLVKPLLSPELPGLTELRADYDMYMIS